MLAATAYILSCSARNRLRRRLARLREPRYLLGALAGSAYLYVAFFGRRRVNRLNGESRRVMPQAFLPAFGTAGPSLAGLLLLFGAALTWAMPFSSGLLSFTKAETEFLFPAPISRPQLVLYRLLRSQSSVFFGALIVAVTYPVASTPARLRGLLATWLVLMTCHVFFTAVTLSRVKLRRDASSRSMAAWLPVIALAGAVGIVSVNVGRAVLSGPIETASDAIRVLGGVAQTGVTRLVLLPFVALVRPLFADSLSAFMTALPAALLVYIMCIVWVIRADAAIGGASDGEVEDAVSPSKRVTAYRARPVAWVLAPQGRAETVFVWKGMLQTFRIVDRRVMVRVVVILAWMTLSVAFIGRVRGLAQGLGLMAAFGSAFLVFMGPQILQLDLRQDLQHLDLLKTWPAAASAIVRGEMIWPATVVTGAAWILAAIGMVLSAAAFSRTGLALRMAAGCAAIVLTPALVVAQYTIHNATALMFPAWISTGRGRPRGVDAMGQRLIVLGGTWLVLFVSFAPGVAVGGLLWTAFHGVVGPWALVPAAMVCVAIVAVEVLLATGAMGSAYERLDLTSIERGE